MSASKKSEKKGAAIVASFFIGGKLKKIMLLVLIWAISISAYFVANNSLRAYDVPYSMIVQGYVCPTGYFAFLEGSCKTPPEYLCIPNCFTYTVSSTQEVGKGLCWEGTTVDIQTMRVNLINKSCEFCLTKEEAESQAKERTQVCKMKGWKPTYVVEGFESCYSVGGTCEPPEEEGESCLRRRAYRTALCEGGTGYQYAGGSAAVANQAAGDKYSDSATVLFDPAEYSEKYVRKDGSRCTMYNTGSGPYISLTVCPKGWSKRACDVNPRLSHCDSLRKEQETQNENSSSSSNNDNPKSDVCEKYPKLAICQGNDTTGTHPGNDTTGVNCSDLKNCDWATMENQIAEIVESQEQNENLKNIIEKMGAGYELTIEELNTMRAIKSELTGVNEGLERIKNALDTISGGADTLEAGGDSAGLDDAIEDAKRKIGDGDTIYTEWATGSQVEQLGMVAMTESTNGVEDSVRQVYELAASEIDQALTPLTDYIDRYKARTKIDMSFNSGVMGIRCEKCEIDIRDINGFDVVGFFNMLFRLVASITAVLMVLRTVRTGGNS